MGQFKFRLPPTLPRESLSRAYVTGQDRTPTRLRTAIDGDILTCHREANESGRVFVPWPFPGFGTAFTGTATLAERPEPYDLAVELARGKLNDIRNQLADWRMMGLRTSGDLDSVLNESQSAFFRAATSADGSNAPAFASLDASWRAGQLLVEQYIQQVIHTRTANGAKLPTQVAIALDGEPKRPWTEELKGAFNATRLACTWKSIAPTEGQNRWDVLDAQLAWSVKHKLAVLGGPIIDLRPGALPDWLYLWDGDYESILGMAVDLVRAVVGRYRGKVPAWTLVHRPASGEILGLGEEDQIRLTARLLQVARHVDPSAQFSIGFDRPWGEWLAQSPFQLGPLHLADYLARSDLGLSGLALEIAPGYTSPGCGLRDLFEFSRLLDLFALINLPLAVNLVLPSSTRPDPLADPQAATTPADWSRDISDDAQAHWAAGFLALAVAKPYVRSVTWTQATDGLPHLYPHGGLLRKDHSPKPIVAWLKTFRRDLLA